MARRRRRLPAAASIVLLALAGCGGSAPGAGGDGGVEPGASLVDRVTVTHEDERTPHALQGGLYRLRWSVDGCERPNIAIVPAQGGEPVYENARPNIPILFVTGLEDGVYYVDQLEQTCTEWSLELVQT
jgi:hypothetical protein